MAGVVDRSVFMLKRCVRWQLRPSETLFVFEKWTPVRHRRLLFVEGENRVFDSARVSPDDTARTQSEEEEERPYETVCVNLEASDSGAFSNEYPEHGPYELHSAT